MLADAALDSSCTVLVGRPQLASPTRQRVASMQKMLPAICADTCWLGPVHAIFERCVALEKVTRQGTSRHQEQTLVGAWSKSFRVCASATNGQDRNAHHSRTVRLAKGATRSMAIGCLARRRALQRQHLPCCLLAGQPARFCSVFRALRFAATAFAKQGT